MKIKLFTFFVVACVSFAVTAQDCTGYIPFDEGAKWEITNYNAKGKELGKAAYELVAKKNTEKGLTYHVKTTSFDDKGKELYTNTFEAYCKNGKFGFDMSKFIDASTMQMMGSTDVEVDATEMEMPPMNAAVGTTLKDASLHVKMSGGVGLNLTINVTDRKVEVKEKIETPAGSFDCIVLSQLVSTKMMVNVKAQSKEWYAEGIGMVASESYNKKGKLIGSSKLTKFEK